MKIKDKIKRWLDVQESNHQCSCVSEKQVEEIVAKAVSEYTEAKCIQCTKDIFAHYGGFYRDYKGRVFCSGKCIDEFNNQHL